MIKTILLMYIGYKIGVPVWFYIVCGVLIAIDLIVATVKALND